MGRIFISAGHGGLEEGGRDLGAIAGGTTEAQEMILLRDQIVPELRSRGFEVLSVPDDLSARQTIEWINIRGRPGDVALEIGTGFYSNPNLRGASVIYIANNTERKRHAELMLLALLRRLPQLPNQGTKEDTIGIGRVAFSRDTTIPSLSMEVGYLSNPEDRALIQARRRDMALGIADGLAAWSRTVSSPEVIDGSGSYPPINIKINNQVYGEKGIIINSNAYIPIDLVDQLGVNLINVPNVRRVQYNGVVYVKAIELRDFNISVGWESSTRSVILRSILRICPGDLDRIMGHGNTSEVQLMMFLKANNEDALRQFPDLPKLYREEAAIEGINYDIAFSQAMLETNFLRFSSSLKAGQNNFGDVGAVGGSSEGASFPSARLGIRAHIQMLKAYASLEPLVQEQVAPRFGQVTRGIAPLVEQLSGRWAADLNYGKEILALVRRLYESAKLL
ncbi:MAG: N-acetylmuramoyl-L-alanine amidase [Coleofasciculaceae cyanobacterium]